MKTKVLHLLVILALVIVALGVMPAPVAYAATFTVTNFLDTSDATPGDGICADAAGQCTLRAAVEESDALAGPDFVYVSPGVYQLTSGAPLQISDPAGTYIFNNGFATQADAVTIDGLGGTQVFYVLAGGTAYLKALNITGGSSGFGGGGIQVNGAATVEYCAVYGNSAPFVGGGIYNVGELIIYNTTISGNIATSAGGGGLYNSSSATLLVMDNVTFHENQAATGDSLYNANANPNSVQARNTIFTYWLAGANGACATGGAYPAVYSQDFNLEAINPAVGAPTCNLTMPGDLTIPGWTTGPLGWNGGPTRSCPISGAPAQDAGTCIRIGGGPVSRDQRFAFRFAPCDIGGYEFGAPLLVELLSFTAAQQAGGVQVAWETASEVDNAGFNVYRQAAQGELVRLNAALIPAQGGPTLGASYAYDDVDVVPGTTYSYMLEDVNVNGQATMHGPVSIAVSEMPTAIEVRAFGASRAAAWLPTFVLVFGAASLAWTWRRKRQ